MLNLFLRGLEMNAKNTPKKILIIKLRKLGDVLLTTPLVRQIRILYPHAQITFLSEPLGAQVFINSSKVDRIWKLNKKPTIIEYLTLCYKVYKEHFDLVIDLYDHNKTALITLVSRANTRMGYIKENKKSLSYNYPFHLPDSIRNKVYNTLHGLIMTKILGTNEEDLHIEYPVSQEDVDFSAQFSLAHLKNNTIVFCAQSERAGAQVPISLLVKIGNFLIKKGYFLYFVYGPGEKEMAGNVYNKINQPKHCLIEYDIPSIAQVRAIFERCIMYVGNDGGNKHLAVAAKIPTIGLFYGDAPSAWTPPKQDTHRYLQTKNNKTAFDDFVVMFERWDYGKKQFVND